MSKKIVDVGVVGSGTMGSAICQHFMMKGLNVVLLDISEDNLQKGRESIDNSLHQAVERKILSFEKKETLMKNLITSVDFAALSSCQLVVEAVFEDFTVKTDLFGKLEEHVAKDCILATNTSSFPITKLAEKLNNPERFLGTHYFYHAAKNKLIELIPGEKTNSEFIQQLDAFYSYLDKCPIQVKDIPGFAINRFFVPWLNEAVRLYQEGQESGSISMAQIDKVACDVFNIGMGPFALMNATGVPIAMHAAKTLEEAFGSFYAPAKLLVDQVKLKKQWVIGEETTAPTEDWVNEIKNRLLGSSLGVALEIVSSGVTDSSSIDLGARLGLRWGQGPIEMVNEIGPSAVTRMVEELFAGYHLAVPSNLSSLGENDKMAIAVIKSDIKGEVGLIEINRPDSMNALNEQVVEELASAFNILENNAAIKKIVLLGNGKAFVAGADIKFFIENIKAKQIDKIVEFTTRGQEVFKLIANSKKETYAFIDGLTLGGGLELALCTQHRISTKRSRFAFPETSIGIYPGLGGTQRTTRLIGAGLTKFLIATGEMIDCQTALQFGLVDAIVERPSSRDELISLLDGQSGSQNLDDEYSQIEATFAEFEGGLPIGIFDDEIFKRYEEIMKSKAPLALMKAIELVQKGKDLELDEALELELSRIKYIFKTMDALTGLSSVIDRRPVKFVGN